MKERMSKKKAAAVVIIAAAAAVILILALLFASGSKARDLSKQLDLGKRYLEEMDYDNALIAFNRAIEIDPKNVDAYIGAAEAYIGKGDKESAEKVLEKGLENVPDSELLKKSLEELTGEEVKIETPTSAAKASSSGTSSAASSSAASSSASSSSAESSAASSETSSAVSSAETSQESQQKTENPTSAVQPATSSKEPSKETEKTSEETEPSGPKKAWIKVDKTVVDVFEGEEPTVINCTTNVDCVMHGVGSSSGGVSGGSGVGEGDYDAASGIKKWTYTVWADHVDTDLSEDTITLSMGEIYYPKDYITADPVTVKVIYHYPRGSARE